MNVEIINSDSAEGLASKVNSRIRYLDVFGKSVIDIKYSTTQFFGDNILYSAMVIDNGYSD